MAVLLSCSCAYKNDMSDIHIGDRVVVEFTLGKVVEFTVMDTVENGTYIKIKPVDTDAYWLSSDVAKITKVK